MQAEQNNMMRLVFWQNISTFPLNNVALLIRSFFSVVTTTVLHISRYGPQIQRAGNPNPRTVQGSTIVETHSVRRDLISLYGKFTPSEISDMVFR